MHQRQHKKLRTFLLLFAVIILAGGIGLYFWLHSITTKIFIPRQIAGSAAASTPTSIQEYLKTKTPFSILLLGYGGGNHDGKYLTDSMIVAHVDPNTKKVFLISIPRDIWVKIPVTSSGIYSKINAAYQDGLDDSTYPNKPSEFQGADGGGRLAEYVVSQITGVTTVYFVGMDFAGFTNTINTLGGVDITVSPGFDDYQYPIEGQEDNLCGVSEDAIATMSAQIATGSAQESDFFPCRFEHVHFDPGPQHMDGATALTYVRSRHSLQDGTDFGRAQRQRNLIIAVKNKIFSAGFIPKVIPFMTSLGDDLRTDLTLDDVKTLVQSSSILNTYQVVSLALTDQNYLQNAVSSDGQDILEPKAGLNNWSQVHTYLQNEFSGKQEAISAVVQVENGTTVSGLAASATEKIQQLGIQTVPSQTAANQQVSKTTITVYGTVNQADLAKLKKLFGVATVSTATRTTQNYTVLVVLGSNYKK